MKVVIVGAGQAGGWFARTLRDAGFDGEVTLVGEETHPPYQRPPLSKDVLVGKRTFETTYLWPAGLPVEFVAGARAVAIDRDARQLRLADNRTIGYDKLVLATGGRVRKLPISGAHYLRTIEDCTGLHVAFKRGGTVLVVGGGWIGLEAAAAARALGCSVKVVEAADRLCGRVMPTIVSEYLFDLHTRQGVEVLLNNNGDGHAADTVIIGIGIAPNVELAEHAGLAVANGIVVDEFGVTSDRDILAIGDVANLRGIRLESWANAQNQAIAAAKSLAGTPTPYRDVPWFWSNQYHVNMQFLGLPSAAHSIVRRGDIASDKFMLFFLDGDRIGAVVAVNQMREIRVVRKFMESGKPISGDVLADESRPLQDLLPA